MSFTNILKGIGGEFEIGRVALALGTLATVVTPIVFYSIDMAHNGWHFDVTAWCVAYPGGIVALVSGGVLAIASKEKTVAVARQTQAMPPLEDKGASS